MDLFVYGTLTDRSTFEAVTGVRFRPGAARRHRATAGTVRGYRIEWLDGMYPYAVPDPHAVLEGLVIYGIDEGTITALDAYEGGGYRRTSAEARTAEGTLPVELYVASEVVRPRDGHCC